MYAKISLKCMLKYKVLINMEKRGPGQAIGYVAVNVLKNI